MLFRSVEQAQQRIASGIVAYDAMQKVREDPENQAARATLLERQGDLGHALLLKRYRDDIVNATEQEIEQAAWDTVPNVPPLFWSFRIMVGLGFYFIALFALSFYLASRHRLEKHRWYLRLAMASLPLPWVAAELGWIVAEYGRQPWVIEGVLPTFLGVSSVSQGMILFSLGGFVLFYTTLAIVEMTLMVKYVRRGPDEPDPAGRPVQFSTAPAE